LARFQSLVGRDPILINSIGHAAGVLLFGLIIGLLLRDWRTHGIRRIKLSLVAAILALGWNIGSLIALAVPDPGPQVIGMVATASFSMLSLLPAVLLQVTDQGRHRGVVIVGYIVSGCAVALHLSELFLSNIGLHPAGLLVIVLGFGVLTIAAFLLGRDRESMPSEPKAWISLACLLVFTSSFLHFGYQHPSSPWAAEIAWHHIGIPVALIVLLRDYRFLLLDTFVRFLVNSGVAAAYVAAMVVLNFRFRLWDLIRPSMWLTGMALVGLCLSLILFAYCRNALQTWITRVIFRRQSVEDCIKAIGKLAMSARSEGELLEQAAHEIAVHLRTDRFAIVSGECNKRVLLKPSVLFRESDDGFKQAGFHAEAEIPLRFSNGDARYLLLGARRGGRRYWSDDLEDMRLWGATVVEQVERFRGEELKRLASQAELRALEAQINPHFLFNALNTLYGTIDRRSFEARRMVLNLAEIFRYFLQSGRTLIPLREELRIASAYLEIEALRLGDRLEMELVVPESVQSILIPILSIQPLVENAIKHGIAAKQDGGRVTVRAESLPAGLWISIEDTGIGIEQSQSRSQNGTGLGLDNVRRRLTLCYGAAADLQIQSSTAGTTVTFLVPDSQCTGQVVSDTELDPLTARSSPFVAQRSSV
jgi:two-component system, LytTR family, sensor kinase